MSYEVLYRKWRPSSFRDVAGQGHVTTTLRNAVKTGHVSHAYLFAGPRGTGKTSTGRILAKTINCEAPVDGEPCNACQSCETYDAGRALDLVEMDAASNRGIEDIRDLRDRIGIAPGASRYRVYLIDEVHQLTSAAFNALLKTLEEPPPHAVFILATTESHDVPATIASRCQRFDFRRITAAAVVERLREIADGEAIGHDDEALSLIARQSTGSLRDAVNLLDQIATQANHSVTGESVRQVLGLSGDARTRELAKHLIDGDLGPAFEILGAVRDDGIDVRKFHKELLSYLRNLLVVKAGAGDTLGLNTDERAAATELIEGVPAEELLKILRALSDVDFRGDPQSSLPLELAVAGAVLTAPQARPMAAAPPAERPQPSAPTRSAPGPAPARPAPYRPPVAPAGGTPVAPPVSEPAQVSASTPPAVAPAAGTVDEPVVHAGAAATSPVPAATPIGAGDASGLPADFMRLLYQTARRANPRLAAFVDGSCEVAGWEPPRLTLGVYDSHKFVVERLMAADAKQVIEAAATELLGAQAEIACVIVERKPRPGGTPAAGSGDQRGGHLVEAARQMGAQPIGPK